MNKKEIRPLANLKKRESAGERRPGYVKRCLEVGALNEQTQEVHFTPEQWEQLRKENWGTIQQYPMPSLMQQMKNAMGAAGRVAKAVVQRQKILRTPQEEAQIIEICKECEFLRQSDGRCTKCGCTVISNIFSKAKLATEKCPIDKWGKAQ